MTLPHASETRKDMRQSIGYNLGTILVSTATHDGSTSTLKDTSGLAYGGTDDYKGQELIMVSGTEANIGVTARVSSFASNTLTFAPTMAITKDGDGYELHKTFLVAEINNQINQAILGASDEVVVDKEDHSLYKEQYKYEYEIPSGFVALSEVEYEYDVKIDYQIHHCDSVWNELSDEHVTPTVDTAIYKEGSGCMKFVVAAGCSANDILGTEDITALDITDCDEVIAWVYSTTDLDADDMQILLDDTAECGGTPLESLNIPAVSAYTWTRVAISLGNPSSDSAIISVGVKMVTDNAFTFWIDDIRAQKADSRIYRHINPERWVIIQAATPLLKIDESAYATIANNQRLRLQGYAIPSEISSDSSTCEIDPDYVVAKATANLGVRLKDFNVSYWQGIAERKLLQARTPLRMNTRWVFGNA